MNVSTNCTDKMSVQSKSEFQGVLRTVGEAGRIAIPKRFLKLAGINGRAEVEMLLSLINEIYVFLPDKNVSGYKGISRIIKSAGQLVIPAEYRRETGLIPGVTAEILMTSQNEIIIRKFKKM